MLTRFGKLLDFHSIYALMSGHTDAPFHISNMAVGFSGLAHSHGPSAFYYWKTFLVMYGYKADIPYPFNRNERIGVKR